MAGSFGGGLGVIGQGFFQGLDRSVAHGSANQGNILKILALARQQEALKRQQTADAVKMIDTDPEGALQVIPTLGLDPSVSAGLMARAKTNSEAMRQGQSYLTTALTGGDIDTLDPGATRFLKEGQLKIVDEARQRSINRGLGRHFAPTLAETPRDQLHTILPKRAAEYQGPGDPYEYINRNKLAESAGGFLPHNIEDQRRVRSEVEQAINAIDAYGADPKRVAAALIARNIPVAAINRADPKGAAVAVEMEAIASAKGKAVGEAEGAVTPVPAAGGQTAGQVAATQRGAVARAEGREGQLGKEEAPGYANMQRTEAALAEAQAALARARTGQISSEQKLQDLKIISQGLTALKALGEVKYNEAIFKNAYQKLLGIAPSPDKMAAIAAIDKALFEINRQIAQSITTPQGPITPGAPVGQQQTAPSMPRQTPTNTQRVFPQDVRIRDPRTGRTGTLPAGRPLPPGAEIIQ